MILSVSRRTDIPALYSEWFFNQIRDGFVCVRNPMSFHQVSRISLSPEVVDGIVFWSKNPAPMLEKLDLLRDYMYIFQFTVTPYGRDIEANIPDKRRVIIPAFRALSRRLGPERVIWRYDPILLSEKYTAEYHARRFAQLAQALCGYTRKCIVSFVDLYRNTRGHAREMGLLPPDPARMYELAGRLADAAARHGIALESCAEEIDLAPLGIAHGHCIDRALFERLLGCKLDLPGDKRQRGACGCAESIDIGMYNTCRNGCKYCYANYSPAAVARLCAAHDPDSPLLSGTIGAEDAVKERRVKSCRQLQLSMF